MQQHKLLRLQLVLGQMFSTNCTDLALHDVQTIRDLLTADYALTRLQDTKAFGQGLTSIAQEKAATAKATCAATARAALDSCSG